MSPNASLTLLTYSNTFFSNLHVFVGVVFSFLVLRIILRFPKARIHRRWAVAYLIAMSMGVLHRIYFDVRLFDTATPPFYANVLAYMFSWAETIVWLYGHVQLWKAFCTLARQHTAGLKDMPFEDWSEPSRSASNPWDASRI